MARSRIRSKGGLGAVLTLALVVLVACGSDADTAGEGGAPTGEPTATEIAPEPTGTPEPTGPTEPSAPATGDGEPLSLRIGHNPVFTHAPLSVGRQLGAFEEAGVDVEWVQVETPPDAVSAILAGDLDMTAVPPPTLLFARGEGAPLVAFATTSTGRTDPPLFGYAVRSDSGIDAVEDLRGKSIGINNFGGNFDLHLRHHLEQSGLDPENDVEIQVVNLAVSVQSVLQGQVDAAGVVTAGILLVEEQYPDELELVFSTEDIEGIDYERGYPILVMVASEDFLRDQPETMAAFMEGYTAAVEHIRTNPDEAKQMWAEDTGVGAWGQLRQMASFPDGAVVPTEGIAFDMELMLRYGYVDEEFDMDVIVDNSFAEAAAED